MKKTLAIIVAAAACSGTVSASNEGAPHFLTALNDDDYNRVMAKEVTEDFYALSLDLDECFSNPVYYHLLKNIQEPPYDLLSGADLAKVDFKLWSIDVFTSAPTLELWKDRKICVYQNYGVNVAFCGALEHNSNKKDSVSFGYSNHLACDLYFAYDYTFVLTTKDFTDTGSYSAALANAAANASGSPSISFTPADGFNAAQGYVAGSASVASSLPLWDLMGEVVVLSEPIVPPSQTGTNPPSAPEPATATLSLLALAGLAARRRRK